MSVVLGFDVSSSTIGWCALEIDESSKNIKLLKMNFIKPPKKGDLMERLVTARSKVLNVIEEIKPDYIGIEELIKFMPKSTATTVVVLTTFNRMVHLTAHDYLKKHPELFNVMQIRHGLKTNKDLPKKEDMPELVAKHLGFTFPYIYKKNGARAPESEDMADGVAVALYYAFVLSGKIKTKIKKPKVKKGKVKDGS